VKEGNLPDDDDNDVPNNGPNGGSNKPPDPKDDNEGDDKGGDDMIFKDENANYEDFKDDFNYYHIDSNQSDDKQSQDEPDNSWTSVSHNFRPAFPRNYNNPFITGQLLSSNNN
jgi:hypothetical protein